MSLSRWTAGTGSRPVRDEVQRARWALLGLFAVNGLTLSAWLARLPAMRDALELTPAQLGAVLLTGSIGGLGMMALAPRVVGRLGHGNAIRVFGGLFGVAFLVMGLAPTIASVQLLAIGLFLNGVALAGNNLTINLGSATVERRVRRPILSQFHAAFSIGTVAGSLAGAGAAALSIPLLAQLSAMSVVAVAWRWLAAGSMLPDEAGEGVVRGGAQKHRSASPATAGPATTGPATTAAGEAGAGAGRARSGLLATWREPRSILIGAIILVAVISEFAAHDWLALAMVDGRGAPESVAALVFALFVTSMTVVRLIGSWLLERLGRVAVLRGGAVVSIAGILLFVLAPTVPLAALGVVAWGAGAALNFPIAVSASSDDPGRAANRIAVLSMFAAVAPLVEAPGIGVLAQQVGVRYALLAVAAALVFIVVTARQVAPEGVAAASEDSERAVRPVPASAAGSGTAGEIAAA